MRDNSSCNVPFSFFFFGGGGGGVSGQKMLLAGNS